MWRDAVFGASFLVAAIGAAADLWGNDRGYYAQVAREERIADARFHRGSETLRLELLAILEIDRATRDYVLGDSDVEGDLMRAFYSPAELAHLRDVRRVLAAVRTASVAASAIMVVLGVGLSRHRIRRAVLLAAGVVAFIGAATVVAFQPLFLAFHAVFFPQGNFLFDPARDNLVLAYPEAYWLGVTLRLGASVAVTAVVVAALTLLPIRSSTGAR